MIPPKLKARHAERSIKALAGTDPRLIAFFQDHVVPSAHGIGLSVVVTEGVRSHKRQLELVRARVSMTLQSKHLDGKAIDIALFLPDGSVTYKPEAYTALLAAISRDVLKTVGVRWGGDWARLRDYCHFELA